MQTMTLACGCIIIFEDGQYSRLAGTDCTPETHTPPQLDDTGQIVFVADNPTAAVPPQ